MSDPAKLTYIPLGQSFKKQTKTNEDQGKKWIDAIVNQEERQLGLINNYLNLWKKDLKK